MNPSGVGGVRERFSQMYVQCEGLLLGHARRLTRGDDDRAQDLVQESLLRGYEAMLSGKFRDGFRPCAWLVRILTNYFLNEWRRTQKWDAGVTVEKLTVGGEVGPDATRSASAESTALSSLFDEALEKALAALPEAIRLTILLVDVEDYTYEEAATTLGIPIGTVRSRLARGRYALHQQLAPHGPQKGWSR